jgi:hypothetical protein
MSIRFAIATALLLTALGCAQHISTSPDFTGAADTELHHHVGHRVTLSGPFSLRGKIGPFILVGGRPVYLVSHGTFSWNGRLEQMEGKNVRVTGTLRFACCAELTRDDLPVGRPSDHFYFDAASATVELSHR